MTFSIYVQRLSAGVGQRIAGYLFLDHCIGIGIVFESDKHNDTVMIGSAILCGCSKVAVYQSVEAVRKKFINFFENRLNE